MRRSTQLWAACGLAALFSPMPGVGIGASAQQSVPPAHSLPNGNSESSAPQFDSGLSAFFKVPLSNNIPGALKLPKMANPVADDPEAASRGMSYFAEFNCVGCHAPNGGGGMGPSFSDAEFKYGADPAHHFLVIAHGAPLGMPAWGTLLPENVIWDLVAYIDSISKAPTNEWGHTVSPEADSPAIEQLPAEFKKTDTPWQFTEPFAKGQPPPSSSSGAFGNPPPNSQLEGH